VQSNRFECVEFWRPVSYDHQTRHVARCVTPEVRRCSCPCALRQTVVPRPAACLHTRAELPCRCLTLQVDVSDTVGCGDSFASAIVLGYVRTHRYDTKRDEVVGALNGLGCSTGGTGERVKD